MLSVVNKPFVLSVTMLNVVMLCIVAPLDSLLTHYLVAMFSKKCLKYCQLRANPKLKKPWGKPLSDRDDKSHAMTS